MAIGSLHGPHGDGARRSWRCSGIRGALVACVSDAVLAACGAWRASILARRTYRSHDDGLALATGKAAGSAVVTAL
jgi:hypothetical protein